ncbi:hypothetical protein FBBNIHIM_06260 [Pseudocitrobacter vendiensis]|uniref:Uncharacterized protein n=1 Tax=Pseudocitrobacter vendiensis TaxID=2488306 RepID=A0ABM9F6K3_9ENTR|nr:hypothetical protein FBBNIHIM_06260 [Pseudocitrobacter vendiensis]
MPYHWHHRSPLPQGEGENRTCLTIGTIGPLSLRERVRVRGKLQRLMLRFMRQQQRNQRQRRHRRQIHAHVIQSVTTL